MATPAREVWPMADFLWLLLPLGRDGTFERVAKALRICLDRQSKIDRDFRCIDSRNWSVCMSRKTMRRAARKADGYRC